MGYEKLGALAERPEIKRPQRKPERVIIAGKNQLKLIADTRPGRPYRLLRIELYSEDGKTLIDTFHRRGSRGIASSK